MKGSIGQTAHSPFGLKRTGLNFSHCEADLHELMDFWELSLYGISNLETDQDKTKTMKAASLSKYIVASLLLCPIFLVAQLSPNDEEDFKQKNEFGVDMTQLFAALFPAEIPQNYNLNPYHFQYRRYLGKSNFRTAIGVVYSDEPRTPSPSDSVNTEMENSVIDLNFRVGLESFKDLSPKFQGYYGFDFVYRLYSRDVDQQSSQGGYARGYEHSTSTFGFGLITGIRFRPHPRISLTTELGVSMIYSDISRQDTYELQFPSLPERPDDPAEQHEKVQIGFQPPLSLFLTFSI